MAHNNGACEQNHNILQMIETAVINDPVTEQQEERLVYGCMNPACTERGKDDSIFDLPSLSKSTQRQLSTVFAHAFAAISFAAVAHVTCGFGVFKSEKEAFDFFLKYMLFFLPLSSALFGVTLVWTVTPHNRPFRACLLYFTSAFIACSYTLLASKDLTDFLILASWMLIYGWLIVTTCFFSKRKLLYSVSLLLSLTTFAVLLLLLRSFSFNFTSYDMLKLCIFFLCCFLWTIVEVQTMLFYLTQRTNPDTVMPAVWFFYGLIMFAFLFFRTLRVINARFKLNL